METNASRSAGAQCKQVMRACAESALGAAVDGVVQSVVLHEGHLSPGGAHPGVPERSCGLTERARAAKGKSQESEGEEDDALAAGSPWCGVAWTRVLSRVSGRREGVCTRTGAALGCWGRAGGSLGCTGVRTREPWGRVCARDTVSHHVLGPRGPRPVPLVEAARGVRHPTGADAGRRIGGGLASVGTGLVRAGSVAPGGPGSPHRPAPGADGISGSKDHPDDDEGKRHEEDPSRAIPSGYHALDHTPIVGAGRVPPDAAEASGPGRRVRPAELACAGPLARDRETGRGVLLEQSPASTRW